METPFSAALASIAAMAKASMSEASISAAPALAAAIATSPDPEAKSSDPLALDQRRMVERVARERLPARPGEGPERRRQAHRAEFLLGLLPDRHGLVGEPEPDLGRQRRRDEAGVGEDEVALSVRRRFNRHRIHRHRSVLLSEAELAHRAKIQPGREFRPSKSK